MKFLLAGTCLRITDKTADGKSRAVVEIERNKWDAEKNKITPEKISVWYFGSLAEKVTQSDWIVGRYVILSYEPGKTGGCVGYGIPRTSGFVEIPAELKAETDMNAVNTIKNLLKTMETEKEIPPYDFDYSDIKNVTTLYDNVVTLETENAKNLVKELNKIFYGVQYGFLGPIGNAKKCGEKATRLSVAHHRKDDETTWCDITIWDETQASNFLKVCSPGDIVFMPYLRARPEYNGRMQFSGKNWTRIKQKSN